MHRQNGVCDSEKHPWNLVTVAKDKNIPLEQSLKNQVYEEMGIIIESIKTISESYYHARLTDKNVNNMHRSEHQLLDFFTLKEAKNLYLSDEASKFIFTYYQLITL
jgi:hypothetical protein